MSLWSKQVTGIVNSRLIKGYNGTLVSISNNNMSGSIHRYEHLKRWKKCIKQSEKNDIPVHAAVVFKENLICFGQYGNIKVFNLNTQETIFMDIKPVKFAAVITAVVCDKQIHILAVSKFDVLMHYVVIPFWEYTNNNATNITSDVYMEANKFNEVYADIRMHVAAATLPDSKSIGMLF